MLEMRTVLRELLAVATLAPQTTPVPRTLRRSITVSPADGATVTLLPRGARRDRVAVPAAVAA
jgi:hypothetical protein